MVRSSLYTRLQCGAWSFSDGPLCDLLEDDSVFAVCGFSPSQMNTSPRFIATGMQQLAEKNSFELLGASGPVRSGCIETSGLRWVEDDEKLLLSLSLDASDSDFDYALETEKAYDLLLKEMFQRGFNYMVRVWNYFAGINLGEGDQERYRQFCLGRHQALAKHELSKQHFPAACALGRDDGSLLIYLVAAKEPARHIENPQQVSAFDYPRCYGPQSPSFARAAVKSWSRHQDIYISGTASILGHKSLHRGDVLAQTKLTLKNIDVLLESIRLQHQVSLPTLGQPLYLKVYLRSSGDQELVADVIHAHWGGAVNCIYLLADVCRQELDVEIDAVGCVFV
ncbi:hypothetical protein [Agaribacterium sp. ZY112]|uniref:chorismate transformation enzyme, FkbO/Hyg5 family n=1 Tax=Agaribacterium sp. ZY112 TaxID=3233574 RepID=UPI003524D5B0